MHFDVHAFEGSSVERVETDSALFIPCIPLRFVCWLHTLPSHHSVLTRTTKESLIMETWALALLIIAVVLVNLYALRRCIQLWARRAYRRMKQSPPSSCDIDAFVNIQTNPVNAVKCVLAHQLQIGRQFQGTSAPIPLEFQKSPHVPGLYVSRRRGSSAAPSSTEACPLTQVFANMNKNASPVEALPIVVCTIRMGFGHHRLAYSVSSWALSTGHPTIFHDLLSIDSRTCVAHSACILLLRGFTHCTLVVTNCASRK
jgi:hypothetical protein